MLLNTVAARVVGRKRKDVVEKWKNLHWRVEV
jgi:hypothetical protein